MPHLCIVVNERNRLSKSARCVSLALLHIHGAKPNFNVQTPKACVKRKGRCHTHRVKLEKVPKMINMMSRDTTGFLVITKKESFEWKCVTEIQERKTLKPGSRGEESLEGGWVKGSNGDGILAASSDLLKTSSLGAK